MNARQASIIAWVAVLMLSPFPCRGQVRYGEKDQKQWQEYQKHRGEKTENSIFNKLSAAAANLPGSGAANEAKDSAAGKLLETLGKGVRNLPGLSWAPGLGNVPVGEGAEAAGHAAGGDYDQAVKITFKAIYSTTIGIASGVLVSTSAPFWVSIGVGAGVTFGVKEIMDYILNPPMPGRDSKSLPPVFDVRGRWSGTLNIASLVVEGGPEEQGCDLTKQVKGKPSALTLVFQGAPEAGAASLTAKPIAGTGPGGADTTARLTYRVVGNSFKATGPMQGGTLTLIGKLKPSGGAWSLGGSWSWAGRSGENVARGSGTWSLAAPKGRK